MSNSKPPYERLTRARFGLNGTGSLWLGSDHVLLVNTSFAVERYRRWYFPEIQAIVSRQTSIRLIWSIVFGLGAFAFFAATIACFFWSSSATSSDDVIVLSVMAAILGLAAFMFSIALAINLSMGPSCAVFVQTPHGMNRLSTPNRVPALEKLIARLTPLLLAAQQKSGDRGESLREVAAALDQPLP